MANNEVNKRCFRQRSCSKNSGHPGKCNKEFYTKINDCFWESSKCQLENVSKKLKEDVEILEKNKSDLRNANYEAEIDLQNIEFETHGITISNEALNTSLTEIQSSIHDQTIEKDALEKEIEFLQQKCEKLKAILNPKEFARTKRENNPTTFSILSDSSNSTRYSRRKETKNALEYIHGGVEGALVGAWDLILGYADGSLIEKFFMGYKRGKFIEKLYGKFSDININSETSMKRAIALKYETYMSRRKYEFVCRIQKKTFDVSSQTYTKNFITYGDYNINLKTSSVSNKNVEAFVKSLYIGDLNILPGISGVSRTVTDLTTRMIDLHLKVKKLRENLIWFNNNTNHFVIQFSDDGAPESRNATMTIGSLTMWNFSNRVRSRDFHYLLHTASVPEKDDICSMLWNQHCHEMELLEGNVLHVNGEKNTVEFLPSADQSWQIFGNNVLPASATYPSPYSNVHKADLHFIGGSIGQDDSFKWHPPTMEMRMRELQTLNEFRKTIKPDLSDNTKHKKELEFMAINGIRQLGEPRLGIYSDLQKVDPFHHEVNNWSHVLDLIYKQSVMKNCFENFVETLMKPVKSGGCGLAFAASSILQHHACESTRYTKLTYRINGEQAIKLARYSYRLIDDLLTGVSGIQKIKFQALAKICHYLRDIGVQINRVDVPESYPDNVHELCTSYFNLFALFYRDNCNITVWTWGMLYHFM